MLFRIIDKIIPRLRVQELLKQVKVENKNKRKKMKQGFKGVAAPQAKRK